MIDVLLGHSRLEVGRFKEAQKELVDQLKAHVKINIKLQTTKTIANKDKSPADAAMRPRASARLHLGQTRHLLDLSVGRGVGID